MHGLALLWHSLVWPSLNYENDINLTLKSVFSPRFIFSLNHLHTVNTQSKDHNISTLCFQEYFFAVKFDTTVIGDLLLGLYLLHPPIDFLFLLIPFMLGLGCGRRLNPAHTGRYAGNTLQSTWGGNLGSSRPRSIPQREEKTITFHSSITWISDHESWSLLWQRNCNDWNVFKSTAIWGNVSQTKQQGSSLFVLHSCTLFIYLFVLLLHHLSHSDLVWRLAYS